MCFHSVQSQAAQQLENRFNASANGIEVKPSIYNGFQHPKTPIITNHQPELIQLFQWGLIPNWAKNKEIQKNTLNARHESIQQKPSFKNSIHKRCLVIADGFFEWQWLDEKGKYKEKYLLSLPNKELFAFAGLWSEWQDPNSNELVFSYSILTTDANQLMSEIHNSKKRMPIIIDPKNENNWLQNNQIIMQNDYLVATKTTPSLF